MACASIALLAAPAWRLSAACSMHATTFLQRACCSVHVATCTLHMARIQARPIYYIGGRGALGGFQRHDLLTKLGVPSRQLSAAAWSQHPRCCVHALSGLHGMQGKNAQGSGTLAACHRGRQGSHKHMAHECMQLPLRVQSRKAGASSGRGSRLRCQSWRAAPPARP
jgi:hypothetical protein